MCTHPPPSLPSPPLLNLFCKKMVKKIIRPFFKILCHQMAFILGVVNKGLTTWQFLTTCRLFYQSFYRYVHVLMPTTCQGMGISRCTYLSPTAMQSMCMYISKRYLEVKKNIYNFFTFCYEKYVHVLCIAVGG